MLLSDYVGGVAQQPLSAQVGVTSAPRTLAVPEAEEPSVARHVGSAAGRARTLASVGSRLAAGDGGGLPEALRTAGGIANVIQGGARAADAIFDESRSPLRRTLSGLSGATQIASGAGQIPAIRSAIPALGAGFSLGGSSSVPYLGAISTGLEIGNIAASDAPDERKAWDAAGAAGALVADAFVPGLGMMARGVHALGTHIVFGDNNYAITRMNDAARVEPASRSILTAINAATTLKDLEESLAAGDVGAVAEWRNGQIQLRGVHLDTSAVDSMITAAYQQRRALIMAAEANPAGPEAQELATATAALAPVRAVAARLAEANGRAGVGPSTVSEVMASILTLPTKGYVTDSDMAAYGMLRGTPYGEMLGQAIVDAHRKQWQAHPEILTELAMLGRLSRDPGTWTPESIGDAQRAISTVRAEEWSRGAGDADGGTASGPGDGPGDGGASGAPGPGGADGDGW